MKTIRLTVDLTYNNEIMHGDDEESKDWFVNEVLKSTNPHEQLILHSNCIGDEVGEIKVVDIEGIEK
jgi:hypothetical protein